MKNLIIIVFSIILGLNILDMVAGDSKGSLKSIQKDHYIHLIENYKQIP